MSEEHKVFVGGLSWNTDDDSLYKAFEPHGTIPFSRVCTDRETGNSRGFGFVSFADADAMNKAITALDGTELDGRAISVRAAGEKPPERKGGDGAGFAAKPCFAWQKGNCTRGDQCRFSHDGEGKAAEPGAAGAWQKPAGGGDRGPEHKVFCGSLSWGVDKDKLWSAFEACAGLVDAFVCTDRESGQSRGFGFCKFDSEENMNAAIEKMNGAEVDGRAINVNAAQAKPADGAAAPAPAPASNKRTWEEPAAEEAAAEEEVAEEEPKKKKKKKKAKTEDADAEEETPKKKKKKVRSLR
jgi:nucleolin